MQPIDYIYKLLRKRSPVIFDDQVRTTPVSSLFGFDRGTPIDRYYIEQFLEKHSSHISGSVLEISESSYSKRFGTSSVTSIDILHTMPDASKATIVGDLTLPSTLPSNRFDCFICTQTLNFIYEIQAAIAGAHQMLRPNGNMLATVSGISQISRYDMDRWGDYWRFTDLSIRRLIEPVFKGSVEIECYGNVFAAKAFLDGLAVEDIVDSSLLDVHDNNYQLLIAIVARK